MKNTTFVSAGAGSGKTYTITQKIAQMIKEGECRAEKIILTTYTEAAAKELREKVRSKLYADSLYEAAMNIDNAAIGTIHSIAYQLVSRYWYLLGISANVSIMPDEDSSFYISQSLSSLPTEEDLQLFDNVCKSLNPTITEDGKTVVDSDFWKKELKNIIDKTAELCISETDLEKAKEESKKLLCDVLQWNGFDITNDIVKDICSRLKHIFEKIIDHAKKDKEATRKELYDSIKDLEKYNDNIGTLPISKMMSILSKYSSQNEKLPKYVSQDFANDVEFFDALLLKVPASNQVRILVDNYIDTIFRLAIQWKKEYEIFKQERCLLDYSDLLLKFKELLDKNEVVSDIKSRYNVAFVDEFQDCSPLQVQSFVRLSELMTQSIWVGDIKQAIYGFRGTNTKLIKSVIDEVEQGKEGNKLDCLKHCWRSNETIVSLINNVFCEKVFKGQIDDEYIKLGIPCRTEQDPSAPRERELRHIHVIEGKKNKEGKFAIIPNKKDSPNAWVDEVERLLESGYKANEIAILYRNNKSVDACAKILRKRGIAFNTKIDEKENGNNSTVDSVSSFINAIVSFAAREDNELSKAIIAHCVEEGYTTSKILSDKLRYLSEDTEKKGWLKDLDIIKRFSKIRRAISNQSVSAAVETIIVELNLCDLLKRIVPKIPAYNYCSTLQTKATSYEGMCSNLGLSSTLVGFVEYLKSHPISCPGDENGVSVMTYHKSKGLEWPCVILCSLNDEPGDSQKTFFGILTYNTTEKTFLRLVPGALKDLSKNIMDRFEDNEFFKDIKHAAIDEAKRLMYVGMTRPKEQLILATYGTKNGDKWLTSIGCEPVDSHSNATKILWSGSEWNHSVHNYIAPDETELSANEKVEFDVLKQPKERSTFENKFVSPSKVESAIDIYNTKLIANFAERMQIRAVDAKDNTIGNFIHHVMCLWNGEEKLFEDLSAKYGVLVDAKNVATSINKFMSWMKDTYGEPIGIYKELPFSFVNDKGQTINGEIDLVYSTAQGDVLVDYKTYQGAVSDITDKDSNFSASKYSGQISLYEAALKRKGSSIRARIICYMSLGAIVSFENK